MRPDFAGHVPFLAPLQARMAKIILFVLGAGMLFPWNAVVTAFDFFIDKVGAGDENK